ncbi:MAG: phage tail assembly chaperone [Proteobacteria bacterium]|nr:phage tail assembly chaperone [Pseudomonadota bacterium]
MSKKASVIFSESTSFKAKVPIPIAGTQPVPVEFTFIGRDSDEYNDWWEGNKDKEGADFILTFTTGWELDDPFDHEHITKLLKKRMGSFTAIFETYLKQNCNAKLGN